MEKQRPRKRPSPPRKYVIEFTTRAHDGKCVCTSTEDGPRVSFVSETEATVLPRRVYTSRVEMTPVTFLVTIPQVVEPVTDKIRRTGRRRHPGRTMTVDNNDDMCPNSLTPMVKCPRCGAHFRISIGITPLKEATCSGKGCKGADLRSLVADRIEDLAGSERKSSGGRKRDSKDYFEELAHGPLQKSLGVGVPESADCSMSNLGTMMICPRCGAILIVGVHIHESPMKPMSQVHRGSDSSDSDRKLKEPETPG